MEGGRKVIRKYLTLEFSVGSSDGEGFTRHTEKAALFGQRMTTEILPVTRNRDIKSGMRYQCSGLVSRWRFRWIISRVAREFYATNREEIVWQWRDFDQGNDLTPPAWERRWSMEA
jgi:hypothetical protein